MVWNDSKPLEPIDPKRRRIRVTLVSFAGALAYLSVISIFGWKFGLQFGLQFGAILLIPIGMGIRRAASHGRAQNLAILRLRRKLDGREESRFRRKRKEKQRARRRRLRADRE